MDREAKADPIEETLAGPESRPRPLALMADNDAEEFSLLRTLAARSQASFELRRVPNGEELIRYLKRQGSYRDPQKYPMPRLIILDLNMPRVGGKEAIEFIRRDPALAPLPVLVFSSSRRDEDVRECYAAGANAYIVKPTSRDEYFELVKTLDKFWFWLAALPRGF